MGRRRPHRRRARGGSARSTRCCPRSCTRGPRCSTTLLDPSALRRARAARAASTAPSRPTSPRPTGGARRGRSSPTCSGSPPPARAPPTPASALSRSMVAGVERRGSRSTGRPTPGAPLGAVPQTWSTLALRDASADRVGRDGRPCACPPAAQLAHGVGGSEHDDQVAEGHDLVRRTARAARRRARARVVVGLEVARRLDTSTALAGARPARRPRAAPAAPACRRSRHGHEVEEQPHPHDRHAGDVAVGARRPRSARPATRTARPRRRRRRGAPTAALRPAPRPSSPICSTRGRTAWTPAGGRPSPTISPTSTPSASGTTA